MGGGSRNCNANNDNSSSSSSSSRGSGSGSGSGISSGSITNICGRNYRNNGSNKKHSSGVSSQYYNNSNNSNNNIGRCKLTAAPTTAKAKATPTTTPTVTPTKATKTAFGLCSTAAPQQTSPPRARPLRQRVMCRCCLSEQQPAAAATSSAGSEYDSDLDDVLPATQFVPLDTLAMVDLCEDGKDASYVGSDASKRRTSSSSSGSGGGSSAATHSATTLLDCLNACARIGASPADIELPQYICLDCCHTLEMCCEFIRCVRNADKILRRRCALSMKRARPSTLSTSGVYVMAVQDAVLGLGSALGPSPAKRRVRRDEKLQPLQQINGSVRDRVVVAGSGAGGAGGRKTAESRAHNTPSRCEQATSLSTLEQVELDFIALDAEQTFVRSFDSGIEMIDEDQYSSKLSDCSSCVNEVNGNGCQMTEYDGYKYIVAEAMVNDLARFHRNTRQNSSTGAQTPHKCGFCIYECNTKYELNKHLQTHLGTPQHSCEQCSFTCHFKYLLLQHKQTTHRGNGSGSGSGGSSAINRSPSHVSDATSTQSGEAPRYHCHLCPECFVNYDALQQHRKSHKVYCQCTACNFKSSTRENVLEHMAKEHKMLVERRLIIKYIPLQRINSEPVLEPLAQLLANNNHNVAEQNELRQTATPKDNNNNKYRKHLCQFCGKCFDRRFHLLKHEYSVHPQDGLIVHTNGGSNGGSSCGGTALKSATKYTKLKYLRQRKAVQAARQQRSVNEQLKRQRQDEQSIANKFECDICATVFMFNFELKYHMRTHKSAAAGALSQELTEEQAMEQPPETLEHICTPAVTAETAIMALSLEMAVGLERNSDDSDNSVKQLDANSLKLLPAVTALASEQKMTDNAEPLDLMALVTQQSSPLNSLDASPTSSNNSYDINYDDQLYLNDFDLGLLDCAVGFPSF